MRIIAGKYKGRKLEVPKAREARPTSEKVREAVFSMLQNYMEGAKVADLFAGTGAMGLEALSRGAASCIFSENNISMQKILAANIKSVGADSPAELYRGDYRSAIDKTGTDVDIYFLDPPYSENALDEPIRLILSSLHYNSDTLFVLEHDRRVVVPEYENLSVFREKRYGNTAITILRVNG